MESFAANRLTAVNPGSRRMSVIALRHLTLCLLLLWCACDAHAGHYQVTSHSGGVLSSPTGGTYPYTAGGGASGECKGGAGYQITYSGPITTQWTWVPSFPGDSAPAKVVVSQSCRVSGGGAIYYGNKPPGSGTVSVINGLEGAVTGGRWVIGMSIPAPPYYLPIGEEFNYVCENTIHEVRPGGNTIFVRCDPVVRVRDAEPCDGVVRYSASVSFLGVDMGRHNGRAGGVMMDGAHRHSSSDPTYTRWLPLAFVPHINTQPFRVDASGPLRGPWGNIACAYSIHARGDIQPDRFGAGNYYFDPALGGKIVDNTKFSKPEYVIFDADGDRLTFDINFTPFPNIKCDVSRTSFGITLSNAGPPGSIDERGEYTYEFEAIPASSGTGQPSSFAAARLLSIRDRHGNRQSLDYSGALGPGSPYLVVTDHTSNRQLFFYVGANGYISSMVAPDGVGPGTQPAVTTSINTDSVGHMTALRVYAGGLSGLLIREETYTYTGDQLVLVNKDGRVEANTYVKSPAKDSFGADILRIGTTRLGSLTDYSSSDDGATVQGVVSYDWGTVREGYPGHSSQARTNYVTDARGNRTTVRYGYASPTTGDDTGAITVIETERPTFTGAAAPSTVRQEFLPDIVNPQRAVTYDGNGMPWSVTYDTAIGLPTSMQDPLAQSTSFVWGGPTGAELLSVTDPTNVTTSFSYLPDKSRLTEVKDAAQAVQASVTYNSYGQPQTVAAPAATHASGQDSTVQMEYGPAHGDLVRVVTPDGAESLVGQWDRFAQQVVPGSQYDALGDPLAFTAFPDTGNKATSTKPLTTLLQWDAAQQVTGVLLPNGLRLANTYNTQGQALKAEALAPDNSVLARTTYTYDTRGRLYKTADLLGTTGEVRYDKSSNLRKVIDARGNATTFTYGPNDELTQVTTQGGKTSSLLYDKGGRVRETTDARGVKTAYTYDLAGRLKTVSLPAYAGETLTYAYDAAGRLLSVTKPNGDSATFTYSPPNRWLTSVVTTTGGRSHTVTYSYYPDGRRQSMTSTQGGTGKTTTYTWDIAGRVKTASTPGFGTTAWTYDFIGRMLSQVTTSPQNQTFGTTYEYGNSGRPGDTSTAPAYLRWMRHTLNGAVVREYGLTHSLQGQLLSFVSTVPGSTTGGTSGAYTYDLRGRLTGETNSAVVPNPNNGGAPLTLSATNTYTYDAADNLNAGGNGWVYNADNQVTSAPAAGGLPGATGIAYNAAGQLTALDGKTLTYNPWGELATVTDATRTISYAYDVLGRRASRTDLLTGDTTWYDYDGDALIGEKWVPGSVESGPATYTHYHWGADGVIGDSRNGGAGAGTASLFPSIDGGPALDWLSAAVASACQSPEPDAQYYAHDRQGRISGILAALKNVGTGLYYVEWRVTPQQTIVGSPVNYGVQQPANPYPLPPMHVNGFHQDPTTRFVSPAAGGLSSNYNPGTDEDIDIPIDEAGHRLGRRNPLPGIHGLVSKLRAGAEFLAHILPPVNFIEATTGQSATRKAGCRIGLGERILAGLGVVPVLGVTDDVARTGRAITRPSFLDDVSRFARYHRPKGRSAKSGGGGKRIQPGSPDGGLFPQSELPPMVAPQNHGDLRARMGTPPFEGAHAHHELPWEFREWFAQRGINVNDPKFGLWVTEADHKRWTPEYRAWWGNYIRSNPNAKEGSVLLFLKWLRSTGKYK